MERRIPITEPTPSHLTPDNSRRLWQWRTCAALASLVLIILLPRYEHLRHQSRDAAQLLIPSKVSPSFLMRDKAERGKSIHVIGERHSGTNMIMSHLKHCFKDAGIFVTPGYTRWKHWFQYNDQIDTFHEIYVVAIVRNPFDWVESMRVNPTSAPLHTNLSWKEFVTKPWTMPRYGRDLHAANTTFCYQGFSYLESIPCVERDKLPNTDIHPRYELRHDKSGLPYNSVVDLRRDKILNHLEVAKYPGVSDYKMVRFEDMIKDGTESILKHYEEVLGVKSTCQPRKADILRQKGLPKDYIEWIRENVDWETERLVGYDQNDHIFLPDGKQNPSSVPGVGWS